MNNTQNISLSIDSQETISEKGRDRCAMHESCDARICPMETGRRLPTPSKNEKVCYFITEANKAGQVGKHVGPFMTEAHPADEARRIVQRSREARISSMSPSDYKNLCLGSGSR